MVAVVIPRNVFDGYGRNVEVVPVIQVDETGAPASSGGGGGTATATVDEQVVQSLKLERIANAAESVTPTAVKIDQTTPGTTNLVMASGPIAHGAADAGKPPMKIGGKIVAALSGMTLEVNGDITDGSFDLDGALIVRNGGAIGDRISNTASNTDGTVGDCIAAQAANIKVNLTDVTLVNSHATLFVYVDILDGATIRWRFPVPPQGGVTHRFETPLTGTAATAWRFDPSAAAATIYCSMAGRLSKV